MYNNMDYQTKPRDQKILNAARKGKSIVRGGVKRIHLLREIELRRYTAMINATKGTK